MTTDGRPDDPARDGLRDRLRRLPPPGLRLRVLAWFVGLLTVATVTSVLVIRQVLLSRLDERIDAERSRSRASCGDWPPTASTPKPASGSGPTSSGSSGSTWSGTCRRPTRP